MGVDISTSMENLYQTLITNVNSVEMDLNVIKSDLKEAVKAKGAFWCDYNIFKKYLPDSCPLYSADGTEYFPRPPYGDG